MAATATKRRKARAKREFMFERVRQMNAAAQGGNLIYTAQNAQRQKKTGRALPDKKIYN